MVTCIKQDLSNTWGSIHEEGKQHWDWVEKKRYLWKSVYFDSLQLGRQWKQTEQNFRLLT